MTYRRLWLAINPSQCIVKELQRTMIGLLRGGGIEVVTAGKGEGVTCSVIPVHGHALSSVQCFQDSPTCVLAAEFVTCRNMEQ